ncbi:GDP-D-glucose phosphorylase 1 [Latimeria chalumnae]|uniref:GDP-D-glucose phosphorylase 1 n=1 Tax=Latimeria chalumnae TaxID=7897 RepID=UPI0003C1675B|nr:PREDICTED: GDP-D-glucose phosphorylase 1 [Latimeria chalumnae]XP_014340387.1 PREDICTED: GDP-D-glucose phosphorylase 1 [Latimeria chalumnae]|eukprot:XP_005989860.1 PREDICTED: GDP-D-glucose phosphorylase 1 [Latimeria chalumnae]
MEIPSQLCNGEMGPDSEIEEFVFSEKDFILRGVMWQREAEPKAVIRTPGPVPPLVVGGLHPYSLSPFDVALQSRWEEKVLQGLFRYSLGNLQTRVLPGSVGFVAQLNVQRGSERRKPQDIQSINQHFNPSQFNFNKIKPTEIIFQIRKRTESDLGHRSKWGGSSEPGVSSQQELVEVSCSGASGSAADQSGPGSVKTLIVINVSPLEFGHVLLIPDPALCLPQVLTQDLIRVGMESVFLSSHPGFRVGFNSLGALASVNHLHLHGYYLNWELRIESARTEPVFPGMDLHVLSDHPARGFLVYSDGTALEKTAKKISRITNYLVERNIAHNLFVTRGAPPGQRSASNDPRDGVRVVVWARKSCFGVKEESAFNVALCELAGHLPIKNLEDFTRITEAEVISITQKYLLSDEDFSQLQLELQELFCGLENQGSRE